MSVSYPGGKAGAGVYQAIINQMPPHETYIEPFVGGGGVLRHKRPADQTIVIDRSELVIAQWRQVEWIAAICQDGIEYLERRPWTGRELVYCDPPYLPETRSDSRQLYLYEMDGGDHERLLTVLLGLPCPVAISGYASDLYADRLSGWRVATFTGTTRGGPRTEYLWMNYPEPAALHDYRYLGADYRERERIKRKALRWRQGLDRLPELERRAILSQLLSPDVTVGSAPPIDLVVEPTPIETAIATRRK